MGFFSAAGFWASQPGATPSSDLKISGSACAGASQATTGCKNSGHKSTPSRIEEHLTARQAQACPLFRQTVLMTHGPSQLEHCLHSWHTQSTGCVKCMGLLQCAHRAAMDPGCVHQHALCASALQRKLVQETRQHLQDISVITACSCCCSPLQQCHVLHCSSASNRWLLLLSAATPDVAHNLAGKRQQALAAALCSPQRPAGSSLQPVFSTAHKASVR